MVTKINLQQTTLDTGCRMIHEHIKIVRRARHPRPHQEPTRETDFREFDNSEKEERTDIYSEVARELREQKQEIREQKQEINELRKVARELREQKPEMK